MRDTRPILWINAARKSFARFPRKAQLQMRAALTFAAEGRKADIAKPLKGLGSGVFELALKHHSDAYRIVYAVQIGEAIWVLHAFQKKAKYGRKTPQKEVDLVRERLKRVKKEYDK